MEWLRAGARELARKFTRAKLRLALWRARRELARAEIDLGLLGWEQVDFFDDELNAAVAKIHESETSQARLMNAAADLAARIERAHSENAAARGMLDEVLARTRTEKAAAEQSLGEAESEIRARRETRSRFQRALAELAAALDALEKQYFALLAAPQPDAASRAEILRIRDQQTRLATEQAELRESEARAAAGAAVAEKTRESLRARLDALEKTIEENEERAETLARELAAEISACEREQQRLAEQVNLLDAEKARPFLLIGRCLADHGIAPMNQPGALQRVLDLRDAVAPKLEAIEASRAESRTEDSAEVQKFYALLFGAAVTVLLLAMLLAAW